MAMDKNGNDRGLYEGSGEKNESDNFGGEMYKRDSRHCLEIFSEEVWIMFTNNLDPASLENLANSSPFFRELLLPKRVQFLFSGVFKVLVDKYNEYSYQKYMEGDNEEEDEVTRQCMCGKVWQVEWFSQIINLRHVCKNWAGIIDSHYQGQPNYFSFLVQPDKKDRFAYRWADNLFTTVEFEPGFHPQNFLVHFENSHKNGERNPFLNRRVIIFIPWNGDDEEEEDIFPDIVRILEIYGKHVWYLSIDIRRIVTTLPEHYLRLKSVLSQVPNLKGLEIIYIYQGTEGNTEHSGIRQLKAEINLNPIPTLDQLRDLRIQNLPSQIFKEVMRANSHVVKFEVEQRNSYNYNPNIFALALPNLKDLNLNINSEKERVNLEKSTKQWHVEKLTLGFGSAVLTWSNLFALLENKWGSTLTELNLVFPKKSCNLDDPVLKDCASYRLYLPKIKTLKITIPDVTSLDFILPMKDSLEYLEVIASYEVPLMDKVYQAVRNEQVIEFLGYSELLQKSNIWTLFPKLKQIVLTNSSDDKIVCTRREWKREINAKKGKMSVATQTAL